MSTENFEDPALQPKEHWRLIAWFSWFALIALCILWESILAPIKPGGSWAVIKVLPMLFALKGIWQGRNYTMQWSSMLVMLYFIEGVVRLNDPGLSAYLAALEIVLSLITYFSLLAYLKPLKKVAKLKKLAIEKAEAEATANKDK
ncbi:MAG: hypothetical protein RL061_882 [Pseudomonadota bacterium]|jgi:uncharacterized membrane protein